MKIVFDPPSKEAISLREQIARLLHLWDTQKARLLGVKHFPYSEAGEFHDKADKILDLIKEWESE